MVGATILFSFSSSKALVLTLASLFLPLASFEKFGTVLYSKVVRNEFGMSRGTGFVKFESPESAKKCIAAAETPERNVNIGAKTYKSVIQDNNAGGIVLGGRVISVALAVERGEAKKLEEDNKEKKIKLDKRNLYLAREGSTCLHCLLVFPNFFN